MCEQRRQEALAAAAAARGRGGPPPRRARSPRSTRSPSGCRASRAPCDSHTRYHPTRSPPSTTTNSTDCAEEWWSGAEGAGAWSGDELSPERDFYVDDKGNY
ncbi:hypothetical protein HF086_017884 [Spodoptera exigua]|uniref:Uncharacterized protein n=1 Tax=Spodoptera exigua TaxID=7107 RepID=A0A922MEU8_SPOEX|nr:hypothetical protein HF086_017884 [Spodoptera exigua]